MGVLEIVQALIFWVMFGGFLLFCGTTIIASVGGFAIGFVKMRIGFRCAVSALCLLINEVYLLLIYGDEYSELIRVASSIFVMLLCLAIGFLYRQEIERRKLGQLES